MASTANYIPSPVCTCSEQVIKMTEELPIRRTTERPSSFLTSIIWLYRSVLVTNRRNLGSYHYVPGLVGAGVSQVWNSSNCPIERRGQKSFVECNGQLCPWRCVSMCKSPCHSWGEYWDNLWKNWNTVKQIKNHDVLNMIVFALIFWKQKGPPWEQTEDGWSLEGKKAQVSSRWAIFLPTETQTKKTGHESG